MVVRSRALLRAWHQHTSTRTGPPRIASQPLPATIARSEDKFEPGFLCAVSSSMQQVKKHSHVPQASQRTARRRGPPDRKTVPLPMRSRTIAPAAVEADIKQSPD